MKSSSAYGLELANAPASAPSSTALRYDGQDERGGLRAENSLYALTSRVAGRLNAGSVGQDEMKSLLDERQALLDKKFGGSMTRQDEVRLQYVRWSLDRIEDAKFGGQLEELEREVAKYEQFVEEVRQLKKQLQIGKKGK